MAAWARGTPGVHIEHNSGHLRTAQFKVVCTALYSTQLLGLETTGMLVKGLGFNLKFPSQVRFKLPVPLAGVGSSARRPWAARAQGWRGGGGRAAEGVW